MNPKNALFQRYKIDGFSRVDGGGFFLWDPQQTVPSPSVRPASFGVALLTDPPSAEGFLLFPRLTLSPR